MSSSDSDAFEGASTGHGSSPALIRALFSFSSCLFFSLAFFSCSFLFSFLRASISSSSLLLCSLCISSCDTTGSSGSASLIIRSFFSGSKVQDQVFSGRAIFGLSGRGRAGTMASESFSSLLEETGLGRSSSESFSFFFFFSFGAILSIPPRILSRLIPLPIPVSSITIFFLFCFFSSLLSLYRLSGSNRFLKVPYCEGATAEKPASKISFNSCSSLVSSLSHLCLDFFSPTS